MASKVWFITGASTGFGRFLTELVLKNGDRAVATLRKPEVLADLASNHGNDKLLVLKVDVTHPQEIKDAFNEAVKQFGRVDVVFNNAGYLVVGEIESLPEEVERAVFETNVWGALNVSKEAVRVFREANKPAGGLLLQMSSKAGIQAYPGIGHYSATKYTLEGISTALAAEVEPEWNIKVVIIEPGNFATGVVSNLVRSEPHPAYTKPGSTISIVRQWVGDSAAAASADTTKGVEAIYRLTQISDPPLFFPLGNDAVQRAREHAAKLLADTDRFASWSDDLGDRAYTGAV